MEFLWQREHELLDAVRLCSQWRSGHVVRNLSRYEYFPGALLIFILGKFMDQKALRSRAFLCFFRKALDHQLEKEEDEEDKPTRPEIQYS